ncbi:TPA: PD-(D/E)XK nuclease-like domain-containing protein [Streptococcus suis]|nr:PD-(D/E)XK nuclease-like domain-containing protein [Streptococcus suis]HEM5151160.1 PD-(D/E)XK nuclease-like domain-containing protein [Streptococcus suis]HEM5168659.1 PD-(D/E)XK nuclease-like domain-containing protein [Streptococcus suis]
MTKLTEENYYQDRQWLSNSRFKAYMDCEAKAKAIDDKEWTDKRDDTALLVGNYVHSYFESEEAHANFVDANKTRMISSRGATKGELKKEFQVAQNMIDALKDDKDFLPLYHGNPGDDVRKEMILEGEIFGIKVKGKVDSINLTEGYFIDLKTMKTIRGLEWSDVERKKIPGAGANILGFRYDVQLGLYQELLRQMGYPNFVPFVVAVSKEDVPDKAVITIPQHFLDEGLQFFENNVERVAGIIAGKIKPKGCGNCDYCRSKRTLDRVINLDDLIAGIF